MIQEREFTRGLTTREAEKRIQTYGYNELKHKKNKSAILIFLSQFNDFIVWVLIVATVISGIMGDKADAVTILIIVFVNAILGFVQEFKTEKSLEALQELAAPTCKVIRDGSLKVITSRELTLGDVVVVDAGDRIPADGKFIDASNMVVDESLLTGESVGVSKDTTKDKNQGYMGTIILKGRGMILIDAIGMNTEMGKIANLLDNIEEERSPLKERLNSLGKILVIACLVICAVVTILGIIRGNDITEMFLLGVSLAVAAIPEGLAAIVTVALALGVNRMLKRNALVRRLPAVETLGCTSVICSDKTGTLTQNKMTVKEIFINGRIYELDRELPSNYEMLKKAFVYCNDTNYDYNVSKVEKALMGDPTETALISAFFKDVKEMKNFVEKAKRVYDIPFDSTRKMMTVIMKEDNCETCYMKGAPERVINKCNYILENGRVKPMTMAKKKQICSYIDIMSNKALRCIAAAYKKEDIKKSEDVENNLIFIGVAGSMDPPRPEVKEAVMKCKLAGIKPVMITGDHKNTALAIAKSINICNSDDQGLSGEELEKISDDDLEEAVKKIRVFARVSPNHKLRIVKAFKKNNNIVAMTGDGVNDAPAIKEADIGIAMGISGTDVTKEAAAMILTDDNFATIVSAVEEGRIIYDNIRKSIQFLLSSNLSEVIAIFFATLIGFVILKPVHLLWINLITDCFPALALGTEKAEEDIMKRKPRSSKESIFAGGVSVDIIWQGFMIAIITIIAYVVGHYMESGIWEFVNSPDGMTMAFLTMSMAEIFHSFNLKSRKHSIFTIKNQNKFLWGAMIVSLLLTLAVIYIPFLSNAFGLEEISFIEYIVSILMAFTVIPIVELVKYFQRKK